MNQKDKKKTTQKKPYVQNNTHKSSWIQSDCFS